MSDETLVMLADAAAAFANLDAKRVRGLRGLQPGIDRAMWRRMAEQGWLSVLVPESQDGLGLGLTAAATIARRLGYALFPEPYAATAIMATSCLVAGERQGERLAQVAAGECIATVAWQNPAGDLAPASSAVVAQRDSEGASLSGSCRFVPCADADAFIVAARGADGLSLYWVARDHAGLRVEREAAADGGASAHLHFDAVRASAADCVAEPGRAEAVLGHAIDAAVLATSAELVGLMERVLEMTLDYLRTRQQFGKPIGSFQALQHRAVDLWIQKQLSDAAVQAALARFDDPGVSASARSLAASGAKARTAEAALLVCKQAVQMHGAIGFTDEYDLGLYFNRALVLCAWLGNGAAHRRRYGALAAAQERAGGTGMSAAMNTGGAYGVAQENDWNAMPDEAFRAIVRADFEAHYPAHLRYPARRLRWSENREWFLRMAEKGWLAPNWPAEYGGMGLSPAKLLVFLEEQERWGIARFQDHGVLMVGPVLQRFGTEEQRRRFLPSILTCEHIWCQGYSEPGSGSDLASLRTRAVREGDQFVINGHKIWTTLAQDATHMFVLVRTEPEAKKQEGISFLLVSLDSPGITVRPIRDMAGHEEFCEVFLDDVRTPASNLVGELNRGWTIAKSLLSFERIFIGSPKLPEYGLNLLQNLARARGLIDDPLFRDKFTALRLDVAHLGDIYAQFAAVVVRGEPLGADVSLLKIWATETFQRIADLIVETAGDCGGLAGDVMVGGVRLDVLGAFYKARVPTIYGGSNEIQRNILARQVLDLPG